MVKHNWISSLNKVRQLLTDNSLFQPVAILTARSVFRAFGHLIIRHGRPVRDDYLQGDKTEEDIPIDYYPRQDDTKSQFAITAMEYEYDSGRDITVNAMGMLKTKYLVNPAWSVEIDAPQFLEGGEDVVVVSSDIVKSAASCAEFNSRLRAQRQGMYYDFHTNLDLVPKLFQPTSCRIEIDQTVMDPNTKSIAAAGKHQKRSLKNTTRNWSAVDKSVNYYPLAILAGQTCNTQSL